MNNLSNDDDFNTKETMNGNTQTVIYDMFAWRSSCTGSRATLQVIPFVLHVLATSASLDSDKVLSTKRQLKNYLYNFAPPNETADIL